MPANQIRTGGKGQFYPLTKLMEGFTTPTGVECTAPTKSTTIHLDSFIANKWEVENVITDRFDPIIN